MEVNMHIERMVNFRSIPDFAKKVRSSSLRMAVFFADAIGWRAKQNASAVNG
jgi:hypothetical protein